MDLFTTSYCEHVGETNLDPSTYTLTSILVSMSIIIVALLIGFNGVLFHPFHSHGAI